jgi:transposase InsO family protein
VDTDDEGSTLRKGVHVDPQHKTRRQFSRQFKAETIALIRSSGKSVPHVCRDLDLAESVVRRWLAQAEIDDGRREGLTTPAAQPPDLVRRNVNPSAPDRLWISDITYVSTWEGWFYLAVILDAYSRRVVGLALAHHLRTELATDELQMALTSRQPGPDLIHHSDRGGQYLSAAYIGTLASYGVRSSVGRPGTCWDNAAAESFFATLKTEHSPRRLAHPSARPDGPSSITWKAFTTDSGGTPRSPTGARPTSRPTTAPLLWQPKKTVHRSRSRPDWLHWPQAAQCGHEWDLSVCIRMISVSRRRILASNACWSNANALRPRRSAASHCGSVNDRRSTFSVRPVR